MTDAPAARPTLPTLITEASSSLELTARAPLETAWQFPHPPRQEQTDVLRYLDEAAPAKRFISVEAPVGVGKSPIAMTFSHHMHGAILVPQNALQRQYVRDWPNIPHLRGAQHYECKTGTQYHPSCKRSECDCKEKKDDCGFVTQPTSCPYQIAKNNFYGSRASLTSYAMFLALLVHTPNPPPHQFVVCDESHNLDEAIISASEVAFDEGEFLKHTQRSFPVSTTETAMEYAKEVLDIMWDGLQRSITKQTFETPERIGWEALRDSIEMATEQIENGVEWVTQTAMPYNSKVRRFWVKPLFPDHTFKRCLTSYRMLGLSATPIPQSVAKQLYGVDFDCFSVKSPFPVENRRVHYRPIHKMSKMHLSQGVPKMANAISKIVPQFPYKGIIHCNSFKLGADLYDSVDVPTRRRIMLHRPGENKEALLEAFDRAGNGCILLSPSITEGVDLKDDQGRFNIIAKIPYPQLGDPWVMARKDRVASWYDWRTALAIQQATGRTTRHAEDWSETMILDSCFSGLYNSNSHLFADWFNEALTE